MLAPSSCQHGFALSACGLLSTLSWLLQSLHGPEAWHLVSAATEQKSSQRHINHFPM
ncbi:hypothetical protein NDU88_006961, partial [Pleurodeles waltl]